MKIVGVKIWIGVYYFAVLLLLSFFLFKCTSSKELNEYYDNTVKDTTLVHQIDSIYNDGDIQNWIKFWNHHFLIDSSQVISNKKKE